MTTEQTPCPLRPRQLEAVKWISQGHTAPETAALMSISVHTVNSYLRSAYDATGTSRATGLVGFVLRRGWIQ